MPDDHPDRELETLFQQILRWPTFRRAPSRTDLFKYLWRHRDEKSYGENIWEEALGNGPKSYDADHMQNVCERCQDLADALRDYFAGKTSGLVIELPEGGPKSGYQLQWRKLDDPRSLTRAFWQAHLASPPGHRAPLKASVPDVSIVYTEPLFYQDWPRSHVFRYYDCNAEHSDQALADLKARHEDAYKDTLHVAYPYVSWGDVEARDLIARWFAAYTFIKVEPFITRRPMDESRLWDTSLILFGDARNNRFIADVLRHYPDLPIRLEPGGRVTVDNPADSEMHHFARFQPLTTDSSCTLRYSRQEEIALAILTRVPNPHAPYLPVTILNADFSRALAQMARVLTDEHRMQNARQLIKFKIPLPGAFQVLCAVPIPSIETAYRPVSLHFLTARTYSAQTV
jgi:hypothetical protein